MLDNHAAIFLLLMLQGRNELRTSSGHLLPPLPPKVTISILSQWHSANSKNFGKVQKFETPS
jgi:hypothetical protein